MPGVERKVYKLRMLMSIVYGLLVPVSLIFFFTAILTFNTGDIAPAFLDQVVFYGSVVLPFVLILSCIVGIFCARGVRGPKKNIIGRTFVLLPIVNIICITLMYA